MNPNNLNLGAMDKQFCQGVIIAHTNDAFFMIVDTGEAKTAYAFTPEHMKQLSQSIAYNITEFEKKSRKIDSKWSPGIQSPIQSGDLDDGKGKGKK